MTYVDAVRRDLAALRRQTAAQLTNYDVTVDSTDPLVVLLPDGTPFEGAILAGAQVQATQRAVLQVGGGRAWVWPQVQPGDPAPGDVPEALLTDLANVQLAQDATMTQVADAVAAVGDAQAVADSAAVDAAAGILAAAAVQQEVDGVSAILTGTSATAPTIRRSGRPVQQGDMYYRMSGDTPPRLIGIQIRGASAWVTHQILAGSLLVPGSVGSVLIEDGAVTAPKVHVDALNFKTATGMELTSGKVIGARVATADTGPRTELSTTGLARYRAGTDGDGLVTTVELGGASSDRLALTDAAGAVKATLDGGTGQAGFAGSVNAADFTIGGDSLAARIAALPQGIICMSRLTIDGPSAGTGAVGLVMMAAQISTSRMYRVHLEGVVVGANAGDQITFYLQTYEPTQVQRNIGNFIVTGGNYVVFDTTLRGHLDGAARYSIVYYNSTANRSVRLRGRTGYPAVMTLEDLGAARYNQGGAYARFDLLGGTPLDGGTVPPDEEVPEIFTKLYPLSWSRSWRGGSITTDGLQQGYWSPHQRYSILGFGGTLATDMAGATILGARVFLQSRTWWGATGKARIGVSTLTSAPANPVTTGSTVDSPAFAEGGTQWTDIGTLWTPSMRAITLGVGAGTANIYYGKLAPAATLEVTYRK